MRPGVARLPCPAALLALLAQACGGPTGSAPPPAVTTPEKVAVVAKERVEDHGCRKPHDAEWYHCLGARGVPRLAAELAHHQSEKPHYEIRDVVLLAGDLDAQVALEPLRAMLRNPRKDPTNPSGLRDPFLRGDVARALADLRDTASVKDIEALARDAEEGGTIFDNAFDALVRLDPSAAATYSRDLVARRMDDPRTTWGRSMLRKVLPVFVDTRAVDMMPRLVDWTEGKHSLDALSTAHDFGEVSHARIRLGDAALAKKIRKQLGQKDAVVPAYPEHFVAALGDHPDDVPALVRFAGAPSPEGWAAYDAIDRYVSVVEAARKAKDPQLVALEKGWAALTKGLQNLTKFRDHGTSDLAGHTGFMYSGRLQVRHHASLARLGDAASGKRLLELVAGPSDHASAWIAATHALAMGLPGATAAASRLVLEATKPTMSNEIWEERTKLLAQAVKTMGTNDPGWAALLFDTHPYVQRDAVRAFVRSRPSGACAVAGVAVRNLDSQTQGTYLGGSHDRTLRDGLLALTFLGEACVPMLEALVRDAAAAKLTRGLALQVLAMLGQKSVPDLAASLGAAYREHAGRADEIRALVTK